jgi:hypothetical protein
MLVKQKLILAGNFIELYDYDFGFLKNYKRKPRLDIPKMKTSDLRRFYSINRCKQNVRRLVNSNPNLKKFLTLTFKDNVKDIDYANLRFKLFIEKLRRKRSFFKYIAVIEFQKRGAVHYHLLCNLQYIKAKDIEKLWGNGFIKINRISHLENVGSYIAKYMNKNAFDVRLNGRKAYFTSRNINRPIEVVDNSLAKKIIKMYNLEKTKPVKNYSFQNDYVGNVKYSLFKIL